MWLPGGTEEEWGKETQHTLLILKSLEVSRLLAARGNMLGRQVGSVGLYLLCHKRNQGC